MPIDKTISLQITPEMMAELDRAVALADPRAAEELGISGDDPEMPSARKTPIMTLVGAPVLNLRQLAKQHTERELLVATDEDLEDDGNQKTAQLDLTPEMLEKIRSGVGGRGKVVGDPPEAAQSGKQTLMGAPGLNLRSQVAKLRTPSTILSGGAPSERQRMASRATESDSARDLPPDRRVATTASKAKKRVPVSAAEALQSKAVAPPEAEPGGRSPAASAASQPTAVSEASAPPVEAPELAYAGAPGDDDPLPPMPMSDYGAEPLAEPVSEIDAEPVEMEMEADEATPLREVLGVPLPDLGMSPESIEARAGSVPTGFFARVGYGFRAKRAEGAVAKSLKVLDQRAEMLAKLRTEVARAAGRRAFLAGEMLPDDAASQDEARSNIEGAQQAIELLEQQLASHTEAFKGQLDAKQGAYDQATDVHDTHQTALSTLKAEMGALEREVKDRQSSSRKDTSKIESLEKKAEEGSDQEVLALRKDIDDRAAEVAAYREQLAPLVVKRGELQARVDAANGEKERARQALDAEKARQREATRDLEAQLKQAKSAHDALWAELDEPVVKLGYDVMQDPARAGTTGALAKYQRAEQVLLEDENLRASYEAVMGTIDHTQGARGRRNFWILLLVPVVLAALLYVFLPWTDPFGIYADAKKSGKARAGADVPAAAANLGTSSADLAARALPPDMELYAGLSADGAAQVAALPGVAKGFLSRVPPLSQLVKRTTFDVESVKTVVYCAKGDYTGYAMGLDLSAGGPALIASLLAEEGVKSNSFAGETAPIFDDLVLWSHKDGTLAAGDERTAKKIIRRLQDGAEETWNGEGALAGLSSRIDLGATLWVVLTGRHLGDLARALGRHASEPGEWVIDRVMGAALSLNLAEQGYVQAALQFESDEVAAQAIDKLDDIRKATRHQLKDGGSDALVSLRSVLGQLELELEGAQVLVTVPVGAEDLVRLLPLVLPAIH